jgi:hypothetical protein
MTLYLIFGGIIILLSAFVFILIAIIKGKKKQIEELKNDNKILNENIMSLIRYSDLISKLKKEKEDVYNEILQAQDGEEVCEIISRILAGNNNRVQDN